MFLMQIEPQILGIIPILRGLVLLLPTTTVIHLSLGFSHAIVLLAVHRGARRYSNPPMVNTPSSSTQGSLWFQPVGLCLINLFTRPPITLFPLYGFKKTVTYFLTLA